MKIERPAAADYPDILVLNETALPHVNRISADDLAGFAEQSCYFRIVRENEELAAFLLAFSDGVMSKDLSQQAAISG